MGYNQQFESNDYSPDGNNAIGGNRAGSSPIFEMAIVTQVITTPTNAHDAGTIRFRWMEDLQILQIICYLMLAQ